MANIIKQFRDADGNNIYPVAYAQGGMKMDLLWTNPNPTSNFAAQTISLDLSDYDFVYITMKRAINDAYYSTKIFIVGDSYSPQDFLMSEMSYPYFNRRAVSVTNTGVTFGASYSSYYNTEARSESSIPVRIHGIKMHCVIPTVVNGLQYVEV